MLNEHRTLTPDALDAWYTHCQGIFLLEEQGYFQRHYELDPDADCSLIFITMQDGEIASTVRVFDRNVWIAGRSVHIGGIGEVSTKPAYRNKGYAGALLRMAVDAMQKRDMPLSILFGNRLIYEKMGWRFAPIHNTIVKQDMLSDLSDEVSIRTYIPSDLPFLMGIYDFFAGRLDGSVIRSEAYWKRWVVNQWHLPTILIVEDRPLAYCCVSKKVDGVLSVDELCASPDGEVYLPGFLKAIMHANGCEKARLHAALIPQIAGEKETIVDEMMVRVNDGAFYEGMTEDFITTSMRNAGMFWVDMF